MRRNLFKSKIHRATVTHADLDYEGSVTIDATLMEAAQIVEYEAIHVWNITRGTRLVTYAISGEPGSGIICINGAAAHLNQPGDLVILATFAEVEEPAARAHQPAVVVVDGRDLCTAAVLADEDRLVAVFEVERREVLVVATA